jgi:hypothetical protein
MDLEPHEEQAELARLQSLREEDEYEAMQVQCTCFRALWGPCAGLRSLTLPGRGVGQRVKHADRLRAVKEVLPAPRCTPRQSVLPHAQTRPPPIERPRATASWRARQLTGRALPCPPRAHPPLSLPTGFRGPRRRGGRGRGGPGACRRGVWAPGV